MIEVEYKHGIKRFAPEEVRSFQHGLLPSSVTARAACTEARKYAVVNVNDSRPWTAAAASLHYIARHTPSLVWDPVADLGNGSGQDV